MDDTLHDLSLSLEVDKDDEGEIVVVVDGGGIEGLDASSLVGDGGVICNGGGIGETTASSGRVQDVSFVRTL